MKKFFLGSVGIATIFFCFYGHYFIPIKRGDLTSEEIAFCRGMKSIYSFKRADLDHRTISISEMAHLPYSLAFILNNDQLVFKPHLITTIPILLSPRTWRRNISFVRFHNQEYGLMSKDSELISLRDHLEDGGWSLYETEHQLVIHTEGVSATTFEPLELLDSSKLEYADCLIQGLQYDSMGCFQRITIEGYLHYINQELIHATRLDQKNHSSKGIYVLRIPENEKLFVSKLSGSLVTIRVHGVTNFFGIVSGKLSLRDPITHEELILLTIQPVLKKDFY